MADHTPNATQADPNSKTKRSPRRTLACAALVLLVALVGIIGVTTALAAVEDYPVVETTVSPSSTVINLFDYRVQTWNENGTDVNAGINAGNPLKFGAGLTSVTGQNLSNALGQMNAWTGATSRGVTGNGGALQGMVSRRLGTDGYPVLSGDATITGGSTDSLSHLFDSSWLYDTSDTLYKKAYTDVKGLLQIDSEGYYYYDSTKDYAVFAPNVKDGDYDAETGASGSFTLYDQSQKSVVAWNGVGQFFPFNGIEDVEGSTASSTSLNHYFGLSITTRFIQNYEGYTNANRDTATTFEFSGDDDVWIFIDNVLVADLGGIHDTVSVSMNFVEGTVSISPVYGTTGAQVTTFAEIFADTGVALQTNTSDDGSYTTLENGSTHTLKFFYLERGGNASNLSLKYNLTNTPATGIYKVDQYGDVLSGAAFAVYPAVKTTDDAGNLVYRYALVSTDDDGNVVKTPVDASDADADEETGVITLSDGTEVSPAYVGTTDADGEMVFLNEDGMPYSMAELQEMFGANFILREIKVREGYRRVASETWLYIEYGELQCEDPYDSGVWASPNALVTANNTLYVADKDSASQTNAGNLGFTEEDDVYFVNYYDVENSATNGTLFAVVLKRNSAESDVTVDNKDEVMTLADLTFEGWDPLYGNEDKGYSVLDGTTSEDQLEHAILAAKAQVALNNGWTEEAIEALFPSDEEGSTPASIAGLSTNGVVFSYSASGMQVLLENLPGDPTRYYTYMVEQDPWPDVTTLDPQYLVAYYYTTADSLDEATASNTVRIASHEETTPASSTAFVVQWGSTIEVPNIENRLIYQKFGQNGELVDGATFALFEVTGEDESGDPAYQVDGSDAVVYLDPAASDGTGTAHVATEEGTVAGTYATKVTTDEDGNLSVVITVTAGTDKYTLTSVQAGETTDSKDYLNDGTNYMGLLSEGKYVLREVAAPAGYEVNPSEIKIVVNDSGVYANAGTPDNGVVVGNGPGYIAATMNNFASKGSIDESLAWVKSFLRELDSVTFADFEASDPSTWDFVVRSTRVDAGYGTTPTTDDLTKAMVTYLEYDPSGALYFDYKANPDQSARYLPVTDEDGNETTELKSLAGEGTVRLFTDSGWTALAVYQDYAYGVTATGERTAYQDISGRDLTNLFSNSTFVRVTDPSALTAEVDVYKQLDGSTMMLGQTFSFAIEGADEATKSAVADGAVGLAVKAQATEDEESGDATAGEVEAPDDETTLDDQENEPVSSLTLSVSDDSESVTVKDGAADEQWKTAAATLTFHKEGTYTFLVTEVAGENGHIVYDPATYKVVYQVDQAEDGTLSFGSLALDTDEPEGEGDAGSSDDPITVATPVWYQAVTTPDGETEWQQVTAPAGAFFENSLTVTTTENHGAIKVTKQLEEWDAIPDAAFTFQLTPIDGAPMPADEDRVSTTATRVVTQDAPQAVFADITYTKAGTYTYWLSESTTNGTYRGVTYDPTVYKVTVQVGQNENTGYLEASVTYTVDGVDTDDVVFTNSYQATEDLRLGDALASISVEKVTYGHAADQGEFLFTLRALAPDEAGAAGFEAQAFGDATAKREVTSGTYVNEAAEAEKAADLVNEEGVSLAELLSAITFRPEDAGKTFVWLLSEDALGLDSPYRAKGTSSYQLAVTVSLDEETNQLSLDVTVNGEPVEDDMLGLQFENEYVAVTVPLWGTKELELASGQLVGPSAEKLVGAFNFTLTGQDGAPLPSILSAANDADDTVSFGSVEFTIADLSDVETVDGVRTKDFVYYVTEEEDSLPGVTNDEEAVKTVTVTLTVGVDGTLSYLVNGNQEGAAFTFVNTYDLTDALVTPAVDPVTVTKVLVGRELQDDEFLFQMIDEDGNVAASGTCDGAGTVNLSDLTYYAPGVYRYSLIEVDTGVEDVTYDTQTYQVIITVTDNGEGHLEAVHEIRNAAGQTVDVATFTNVYDPNEVAGSSDDESGDPGAGDQDTGRVVPVSSGTSDTPDTSDPTSLVTVVVPALLGVGGLAGAVALRRKR